MHRREARGRPLTPITVRLLACMAGPLMISTTVPALSLLHMNLSGMVSRADSVFRGTVIEIEPETVLVGGVSLPTVVYTLRVEESFLGRFDTRQGRLIHRMRTLGRIAPMRSGSALRLPALPEMPRLAKGMSYLLFTTAPGPTGLSTTVGLFQGCFRIESEGDTETVVNGFGNLGLFKGMVNSEESGRPVEYGRLSALIRTEVARR